MKALMKFKDDGKENPLIGRPDLKETALTHFSRVSFHEASLNTILQESNINKGSFYFKFYDKMDLYLCLTERVALDKVVYISEHMRSAEEADNIFSRLRQIAIGSLQYALKEPRTNMLWRLFLLESEEFRKKVKTAFPEISEDFLGKLVDHAIASGQLTDSYDRDFVYSVINLHFTNMDAFMKPNMSFEDIIIQVDKVIDMLKRSVGKLERF